MSPYHLIFETQTGYRNMLDVFLNEQRVEDVGQSVHALEVTFCLKNVDVFGVMRSKCWSINILS